jgi:hypothetical protein
VTNVTRRDAPLVIHVVRADRNLPDAAAERQPGLETAE